ADDGVRLWVDNSLIIDQWHDQAPIIHAATVSLATGNHHLKLEYYENMVGATISLWWTSVPSASFKGTYYNSAPPLAPPDLTRTDANVNFTWGSGSPDPTINSDQFSAIWVREETLSAGTYRFTVTVDDGVRLWVDNNLIINQWKNQPPTTYSADVALGAGSHYITMAYYESLGGATAQLSWSLLP
ncbi:MAG: PA14 domain-containing protein, partial [Anaerolineae bacterium]